jgi:hypothetical protein
MQIKHILEENNCWIPSAIIRETIEREICGTQK